MFILLSITCSVSSGQVIDYGIDPEFSTGTLFTKGGVSDLVVLTNNSVNVRGNFSSVDSPISSGGLITSNGELVQTLNYGGPLVTRYKNSFLQSGAVLRRYSLEGINFTFRFEFQKPVYNGFLTNYVRGAFVTPDDLILVPGRFFTDSLNTNDVATLRQLCMVDSTGKPDPDFPMLNCAEPFTAEVYSIDTLSDGSYILAGRFEECNGHTCHNVIKLNPDFSVDTTFVNSLVFRSQARILLVDSLDRIWLSTSFGGLLSNPTDTVSLVRLMANGEVDESFNIPELKRELPDTDPLVVMNGFVSRVIQDNDGTYICSGPFTRYNGVSKKKITKIYDDGSLVNGVFDNWGVDEAVWGNWVSEWGGGIGAIQKLPDGKLLLGGTFSSFGGEPYNCMVRLMPTGYVSLDEREKENDLQVFPNPTTGWLKLAGTVVPLVESIELYNLSGQAMPLPNGNLSDGNIDLSNVPAGIYVLAVYTSSKKLCRKLVKY